MTKTIAYKAFDENWRCRDFQYEVGETYEHKGEVEVCSRGFHACTIPFDCWSYYEGSKNLAQVVLEGPVKTGGGDSKVAGARITIDVSLTLPEWIKRQAETIIDLCKSAKGKLADNGHAAATGYRGHAAAIGDRGHAAATGYRGHAAAIGDRGHAAATGYRGHAAAPGKCGHASSTGIHGRARAEAGNFITLAHWRYSKEECEWQLVDVKTRKVGGRGGLKPNVWYTRDDKTGAFVEAE